MSSLEDSISASERKLIFVGGKGGVGKTSVAAALALRMSTSHKILLISTDPAHSLQDLLNVASFDTPAEFEGLFDVWEPDSQVAFEAFKTAHAEEFRLLFDTSTHLDEEDIEQLLSLVIPGLDEIMGLKGLIDKMETGLYDKIIVDTAPTGHALRLLSTPYILDNWIKVMASMRWKYRFIQQTFKGKVDKDDADDLLLDLKRMVSRTKKLLTDGMSCEFVLISLPDRMNLNETHRLWERLKNAGIAVKTLIINRKSPRSIDPFYESIRLQEEALLKDELSGFEPLHIIEIPRISLEINGLEQLKTLSTTIFNQNQNGK